MLQSMTGYAARRAEGAGHDWAWEIRGVNGKGLDLRLRLPDWIAGLEPPLRAAVQGRVARGSIQVGLRVSAEGGAGALNLDEAAMGAALDALARVEAEALALGMTLAPSRAADIVTLRGVLTAEAPQADDAALRDALMADFGEVLDAFCAMRAAEGARLHAILSAQIDEIAALTEEAAQSAGARDAALRDRLRAQMARVMDNAYIVPSGLDAGRLEQELALLAVKSDVTEEFDRLRAHIAAARDLLASDAPVSRKLDFLCQEFMREANTLCSKSNDAALTRAGLALKTVIEQFREQVQNVE
ncbi:YicC/YloC family endoribonuclease [Citreimonas salinaria]|uniref:TIGR00255 family protein n=1 Tax=Citreimonas salinaria TaxID=321339 RepID=A0A1H3IFD8_9RHOB|nr:YicC/YloC family endoribonuclease [Citreimonas salinaria]SDY26516.1 TIGR00255 family protein [Citreimonas salinaria]